MEPAPISTSKPRFYLGFLLGDLGGRTLAKARYPPSAGEPCGSASHQKSKNKKQALRASFLFLVISAGVEPALSG